MTKAIKICKICGKEYEACHTFRLDEDIFRWQDVACCPEHGAEYFAKIAASRSPNTQDAQDEPKPKRSVKRSKKQDNPIPDIDEISE